MVFHEMLARGYVPECRQYATVMKGFLRSRDIKSAFRLKDEMETVGVSTHDVSESAMVRGLVSCGRIDDAKLVFDSILHKQMIPSIGTFTTLMHGLCKEGRLAEALKLRKIMEQCGLKPDVILYNVLISGLCCKGDTDAAFELFEEMKQRGLWANITTFEVLIKAVLRENDFRGEALLTDIQKRGFISEMRRSDGIHKMLVAALKKLKFLRCETRK